MTHRSVRRSLLATLAALSALAVVPAQAQTVTLRLHQMLPPTATIPARAIVPWVQKVEAESGGKIKVQVFNAMQLGGAPPQLFDQAKDGVVDITWTVLGYTPGRFVKTEVFEIPSLPLPARTLVRSPPRPSGNTSTNMLATSSRM